MKRVLTLLALACCGNAAASEWQPDPQVPMQVDVAETMQQFRASNPELTHLFDEACGIAVFPRVWRAGLVIGGGSGRGPPGPIPNPVVKPPSADGTALWWGGRVGHRRTHV